MSLLFFPLTSRYNPEQSYVSPQTVPGDLEGTPLTMKAYSVACQTGDYKEDEVHNQIASSLECSL